MKMSVFRPYRPSNGTEQMIFMEEFCDRCARDDGVSCFGEDGSCEILASAFIYDKDDPEYPGDTWVVFNGRPTYLAFIERGGKNDPVNQPPPTDPAQLDIFEDVEELEYAPMAES